MAVTRDTGAYGTNSGYNSSLTFSYTVGAGSDMYMFVSIYREDSTAVSTVTWNGVGSFTDHSPTGNCLLFGKAVTASDGPHNVTVTMAANCGYGIAAETWANVDGTTPVGTAVGNTGTGTSATADAGSVPTNGVVRGHVKHDYAFASFTTTNTQNWTAGASIRFGGSYSTSTGVVGWQSDSSYAWKAMAIPVNPVSAGGGILPPIVVAQAVQRASTY